METTNVLSQVTPNISGTKNNPLNGRSSDLKSRSEKPLDFVTLLKWMSCVSDAKGQNSEEQGLNTEDTQENLDGNLLLGFGMGILGNSQGLQNCFSVGKDAQSGELTDQLLTSGNLNMTLHKNAELINLAKLSGMIPANLLDDVTSKGLGMDEYKATINKLLTELVGTIKEVPTESTLENILKQNSAKTLLQNLALDLSQNKQLSSEEQSLLAEVIIRLKSSNDDNQNNHQGKTNRLQDGIADFEQITLPGKEQSHLEKKSVNKIDFVSQFYNKEKIDGNKEKQAQGKEHINNSLKLDDLGTLIDSTQKTLDFSKLINKVDSPALLNQVINQLKHNLLAEKREVKEFDIQLHPAELGNIKISLKWNNGQVHLQFIATEASTGTNLQQNLSQLRHALEEMGVSCGSMQMGNKEPGFAWHQPKYQNRDNNRFYSYNKDVSPEVFPNTLQVSRDEHLINVTA